ncbi:hypothetical protein [Pseudoalteromonas piscicida]|uniref:hypothetical protein n=1 Tax=Pseudoalteromonas piscicida TaxID=43662 RepID=UPI0032C0F93B
MTKNIVRLALASLFTISLTACVSTSTEVKQNTAYEFPITLSAQQPVLIFPVSLHGVPGNDREVGLAITAGVTGKHGASVVSSQQLYDVVGNLSWTVGENMRRHVNQGNYALTGSAQRIADDLTGAIQKLTKTLKSTGVIKDKGFNFNRVIVLHVDSSGGIPVPGVNRVTAFGGIIDLENQAVVSYIEKDLVLADGYDAVLVQMPMEMNGIIEDLINKG